MSGHTPGLLRVVGIPFGSCVAAILGPAGSDAIYLQSNGIGVGSQDENARRLAAAWNGCQGIPIESLEEGVVGELLEALDAVMPTLAHYIGPAARTATSREDQQRFAACEAAIDKARGTS